MANLSQKFGSATQDGNVVAEAIRLMKPIVLRMRRAAFNEKAYYWQTKMPDAPVLPQRLLVKGRMS